MTGAYVFGCSGPDLTPAEASFFREADPLGFILFARNISDPAQVMRLTASLREAVGRDAQVFVDQEGGRVQRLRAPHWREFPPALDQALAGGPHAMYLRMRLIAEELRAVGIDADCAPVADIARPDTHAVLRNRCCGTDAATVAVHARAQARGLLDGGVLPVMKHMPGHGLSSLDTHHELPRVTAPLDRLEAEDFAPFRSLRDLPIGMTAHIIFDAIDPERPATQSPAVIRAIRDRIGFSGLLLSDDLSMQALQGTLGERAGAAIAAGCDVALHCNGTLQEMESVAQAAGGLTADARSRVDRALALRTAGDGAEIGAIEAELAELTGRAAHV
jgi:beta-N-acetylhexosaminidase